MRTLCTTYFRFLAMATVIFGSLLSSCIGSRVDPTVNPTAIGIASEANVHFASDLYSALRKSQPENLIFSPLSVSAVLAMLKTGARGETEREIQKALHFPLEDNRLNEGWKGILESMRGKKNVTLDIANNVYSSAGFELNPQYVKDLANYFAVRVEQLDFTSAQSARTINNWVEGLTHNRIKDLISPGDLDSNTRLVLVNGIYFKGKWAKQFDPEETTPGQFHISPTQEVTVDMMQIVSDFYYAEVPELDAQAVGIPYQEKNFMMIILLPHKKNGLAEMEAKLKDYPLTRLPPTMEKEKVNLQMPKFKLESTIDLKAPLSALGLSSIFSEEKADFTGIPQNPLGNNLYVSKAVQKAFIEVNEEGSEAAAATGIMIQVKSAFPRQQPIDFICDQPFMAIIYDTTYDLHLFWTSVRNPLVAEAQFRNEPLTDEEHKNSEAGSTKDAKGSAMAGQGSMTLTLFTIGFLHLTYRAFY